MEFSSKGYDESERSLIEFCYLLIETTADEKGKATNFVLLLVIKGFVNVHSGVFSLRCRIVVVFQQW